jgi:predicted dehydrogenase
MGSTHLKAYRSVERAEVVAVCSDIEKKLTGDLSDIEGNLGTKGEVLDFSKMRKYRDYKDVLTDGGVDAVDICLPTHLHAQVALDALRAGKHVLVEKPIALNGDVADELVRESEKAGKVLMSAQVLRFFPMYRALHETVNSKQLGPVRSALFRRRCAAPVWSGWLADPTKSGGGVFDLLIHDVDMAIHLFGMPDAVSAVGYEDLPNGIDSITGILHYNGGPAVTITGGWHHKKAYPFSMEYTVSLQGGTMEFSSLSGKTTLYDETGEARPVALSDKDGFEAELQYFVDSCRAGTTPALCPPQESADAVRLTLRMAEARKHNGERISCRS